MSERRAPVQGYSAGIPWSLHLKAWDAYAGKYGRAQSAERLAERGGFGTRELDVFVPGWRDEVSEIGRLRRIEEAAALLIQDVRNRYPGEELRCQFMRALDAALGDDT